ncbi:hypothetical protein ANN_13124 [Periplaneta americana]|uniref:Uncharacterized protein n=1 Tax=Periplaneta americana TaxID=6978 RepID=A0ABQ8TII5_PERAM|nr:hypothetical protein ANN_13124 [Periplaneta americana]
MFCYCTTTHSHIPELAPFDYYLFGKLKDPFAKRCYKMTPLCTLLKSGSDVLVQTFTVVYRPSFLGYILDLLVTVMKYRFLFLLTWTLEDETERRDNPEQVQSSQWSSALAEMGKVQRVQHDMLRRAEGRCTDARQCNVLCAALVQNLKAQIRMCVTR